MRRIFAHNDSMKLISERFETAYGDYVALSQSPVSYSEQARESMRLPAWRGADLVYFDGVEGIGDKRRIVYKPDWSPDTLRSYNYIGSPVIVSQRLWESVCGSLETGALYDCILRLTERAQMIEHVPEPLETAQHEACEAADLAALRRAVKRSGEKAHVSEGLFSGSAAVRYAVKPNTRITVVVYASGESCDLIRTTLESVAIRNNYPHVECVIADGGVTEARKERYYALLKQNDAAKVVRMRESNLSRLCNAAAARASGECLLFLPAGACIKRSDTIEQMAGLALRTDVGVVGAKTLLQNGRLDGGFPLWGTQGTAHGLFAFAQDNARHALQNRYTNCIRNIAATEAPLMVRRELFWEAGGFDETIAQVGFAPALCIWLLYKHRRNVYTPYASFETDSVRRYTPDEANRERLDDILRAYRVYGDPYFSRARTIINKLADIYDEQEEK